ncbi:cob(I)yrinic acid a,c-diamide adenosyltransferase [Candidatus Poribacteria bacterium]|nr:cob(I)yrinic acid a,c-diamide adenosyltransferase [Candidatus Poribacteria bacterium]
MRIYTRTGDGGETGLVGGDRIAKDDRRVEAMGTVDELNSWIGSAAAELNGWRDDDLLTSLRRAQQRLFEIGARLATPEGSDPDASGIPALGSDAVEQLEADIDRCESSLPPLRAFILPGGSRAGASLHGARTVCRRAERCVVALAHDHAVDEQVLPYLNRLSDYLFVAARTMNAREARPEPVWQSQNPNTGES